MKVSDFEVPGTTRFWLMMAVFAAALTFMVIDVGYQGAKRTADTLHAQQIAQCHRGLRDRHDNAEGWYAAYFRAERSQIPKDPYKSAAYYADTHAAAIFLANASDLNSRLTPATSLVWPQGSQNHPLGLGVLDCHQLYPTPHPALLTLP
jgi:hypothetical protein